MDITVEDEKKITTENSGEPKKIKLAAVDLTQFGTILGGTSAGNPWSPAEIDKLEFSIKDYGKLVKACRFFYRKDPIASSTLNKLVEIGVNELKFKQNGLSENEFRIFLALKTKLKEFAEIMALEFLISGLIFPEIKYGRVNKDKIKILGVKKYDSLVLPVAMFIHDPETIEIKLNPIGVTYFVKIPDSLIYFIKNKGKWSDGTEDPQTFAILQTNFPDFVLAVENGITKIRVQEDSLIVRRKPQPDDPYPTPYLSAALESLKHKRNLRRMDYAIASRVISAIQLFRLGDKDFPVTEDDKDEQFKAIKDQVYWRDSTGKDVERIYQLFANHTLQIDWVAPDTEALLNEQKYVSINQDIIYSLGFPRILITGETERTGSSDPQYAMMSPARTMENFRDKIQFILQNIVNSVAEQNNLKNTPEIYFKPLTLFDYQTLLKSLADLYSTGNISRTTYADTLGYTWDDEMEQKAEEQKVLEEKKLGEFAPVPHGANPNQNPDGTPKNTAKTNPSDIKNNAKNVDGQN